MDASAQAAEAGLVGDDLPGFLDGLPLAAEALTFARKHHAGQLREGDDAPFVLHPQEVASLLHEAGFPDPVVAAGALHDVLENTDADKRELASRFGSEVAELVDSVSDDPSIEDQQERRAALRLQVASAGDQAAAIFAADKISKAREVRMRISRHGFDGSMAAKIEHYEESFEMLEAGAPHLPLVRQLRVEIGALRGLAPGA